MPLFRGQHFRQGEDDCDGDAGICNHNSDRKLVERLVKVRLGRQLITAGLGSFARNLCDGFRMFTFQACVFEFAGRGECVESCGHAGLRLPADSAMPDIPAQIPSPHLRERMGGAGRQASGRSPATVRASQEALPRPVPPRWMNAAISAEATTRGDRSSTLDLPAAKGAAFPSQTHLGLPLCRVARRIEQPNPARES